jgi:hypothetical protein
MATRPSVGRLILIPSLVTLGVTLLRLAGELSNGSATLFSRAVGGGAAIVGIIWLVPVFGVYFAQKLDRDEGSAPPGRAAGFAALGLGAFAVFAAFGFQRPTASLSQFLEIGTGALLGVALARTGWPRLWSALFAYGLAARVPVALVVLVAILNDWKTHYDSPPRGLPDLAPLTRWIAIGAIPQLTIWIAVTVIGGTLFGAASLLVRRRQAIPATTYR